MDVFFDYGCPFCLRTFAFLQELSEKYSKITLNFIPMEAHPHPENHGPHTDLCAEGMYAAQELGMDLWEYHTHMFRIAIIEDVNIQSAGLLSEAMSKYIDKKKFFDLLQNNVYADKVKENNRLAYDENGVWAVPAFRLGCRKLDAVEGVGLSYQALEAFMADGVKP